MVKKKEFNPKVQWAKFIGVRALSALPVLGGELVGTVGDTFHF